MFDGIIDRHDVYKVETIGDAYMVVSGLPDKNVFHSKHIALMSLDILEATRNFVIPHFNQERLSMRIGIHSGRLKKHDSSTLKMESIQI